MNYTSLFAPGGIVPQLQTLGQSVGDVFTAYAKTQAEREQAKIARERLAMERERMEKDDQRQMQELDLRRQEAARYGEQWKTEQERLRDSDKQRAEEHWKASEDLFQQRNRQDMGDIRSGKRAPYAPFQKEGKNVYSVEDQGQFAMALSDPALNVQPIPDPDGPIPEWQGRALAARDAERDRIFGQKMELKATAPVRNVALKNELTPKAYGDAYEAAEGALKAKAAQDMMTAGAPMRMSFTPEEIEKEMLNHLPPHLRAQLQQQSGAQPQFNPFGATAPGQQVQMPNPPASFFSK